MKSIIRIFLICSAIWIPMRMLGQTADTIPKEYYGNSNVECSLEMPSLSKDYFGESYTLDWDYEYQLSNKQKRMRMWGINTYLFTIVIMGGVAYMFVALSIQQQWPEWIAPTFASLIGVGAVFGGLFVMRYMIKKADAIGVAPVAQLPLNDKLSLNLVHLACHKSTLMPSSHALGLGLVVRF